jgi:hypothetical protein
MTRARLTSTQAYRAIYIDFEGLKTTPAQVGLLGVLIGAEGEELEQLIVDERLAPGRVAKPRTRVADLGDAVETLIRKAIADDRRITGWSNFDRDRMIEARPDLRADIDRVYVNALKLARPWRARLHPSFVVEREDRFSPKHTLHKYAVLAGYPGAKTFANATPAKWIRHMLEQLNAQDGRYGRITKQAKRDWHKLLDYNRHDLLALRHIVLKSAHELEFARAALKAAPRQKRSDRPEGW